MHKSYTVFGIIGLLLIQQYGSNSVMETALVCFHLAKSHHQLRMFEQGMKQDHTSCLLILR